MINIKVYLFIHSAVTILHGHAEENGWKTKLWLMFDSFWPNMVRSNRSHSFSVRRRLQWSIRNCKAFFNSRFSTRNKFNWFRRFSKCLCLRIRDRRADSRFDIILLFFLSSMFRFELSEAGFWFGSPEPELEASLGLVGMKGENTVG